MQAADMSTTRKLCSSLGWLSKTQVSKKICVRLRFARKSALLLLSRLVWVIWTWQFKFIRELIYQIKIGITPLILHFPETISTSTLESLSTISYYAFKPFAFNVHAPHLVTESVTSSIFSDVTLQPTSTIRISIKFSTPCKINRLFVISITIQLDSSH
jgi:hypothetical protein